LTIAVLNLHFRMPGIKLHFYFIFSFFFISMPCISFTSNIFFSLIFNQKPLKNQGRFLWHRMENKNRHLFREREKNIVEKKNQLILLNENFG
jgi:hypothetical protein